MSNSCVCCALRYRTRALMPPASAQTRRRAFIAPLITLGSTIRPGSSVAYRSGLPSKPSWFDRLIAGRSLASCSPLNRTTRSRSPRRVRVTSRHIYPLRHVLSRRQTSGFCTWFAPLTRRRCHQVPREYRGRQRTDHQRACETRRQREVLPRVLQGWPPSRRHCAGIVRG